MLRIFFCCFVEIFEQFKVFVLCADDMPFGKYLEIPLFRHGEVLDKPICWAVFRHVSSWHQTS